MSKIVQGGGPPPTPPVGGGDLNLVVAPYPTHYGLADLALSQSDPVEGTREDLNLTPCVKSFKNIDSRAGSTFRVVEYVRDQNFYDIIQPIIEGDRINTNLGTPEEIAQETEKLQTFRYEYLSVLAGMETFTGTGTSVKKTQFNTQKRGAQITCQ